MNDSYIIAFTQGSSGRFVKYLLYNLLTGSSDDLTICPITNSTHKSDISLYTGYRHVREDSKELEHGINNPRIWDIFKFDDPVDPPDAPRIVASHVFPDFKAIKNRLGPNVKIIIITIGPHDLKEVVLNDKVKNYYDILTGNSRWTHNPSVIRELILRYERFLGKRYPGTYVKEDIIQIAKAVNAQLMAYLLNKAFGNPVTDADTDFRIWPYLKLPDNIDYPTENILFLPYSELTESVGSRYVWLKKLEDFTGKKINKATDDSFKRYINGRNKLLREYGL